MIVKTMPHKFGMFIHWGIYALSGFQEQYQFRMGIPRSEYIGLADKFNPTRYDPDAWVRLAKEAGMSYICFTAKHMDGFCMWNTAYTDFNIMNTPYKQDTLAMLAEACARHGMALSIYYSLPDCHHPSAYNSLSTHQMQPEAGDIPDSVLYRQYVKNQITELMTGYGRIYTLFWDIPPKINDPSINAYVRSLQPDILINNRGYDKGDFATPERSVPGGDCFKELTEACQSVGKQSWGYRIDEDFYSDNFLCGSIDKIRTMGGSYLLNVGPGPDGRITEPYAKKIRSVGSWYRRVEESFEGDRDPRELYRCPEAATVVRGNAVYLHCGRLDSGGLSLKKVTSPPESVILLNTGEPLKYGIDILPDDYDGDKSSMRAPSLHIYNIPVDKLSNEIIVIKITV
ncbi:MAG: alpha-L-fucosidase [Eubacteriales bacterium]|nr:alpha-L-fucosidase [Eubacteriales bacterium]